MPTATRTYPYAALAAQYAQDVADGRIVTCQWVRLACERQLRDLATYQGDSSPFYYDEAAGNRVCDIISRFPHIKGIWAQHRKKIELEPWQCFLICTVFGWMCTATHTRRFRVAYIEVPRKNAKSTLTSALGNYLVACDNEEGAYVVSAANTRDQAKLVFTDSQLMVRREAGFRAKFGVEVMAHVIAQPETASKFEALSAEHSNLDGLNIHAALIDELHAHPTRGLWDVLETATGSRAQSIIWAITTAGLNRASVCYDQRTHTTEILRRIITDESYFGIIYTIDDGDDPWDEASWMKASPNYGVSIYPETLRGTAARAQTMPSQQNAFFTRHLNIWVNADTRWLPSGSWEKCADPDLDIEDFDRADRCYIGLDLAMRSDIAALMVAFPPAGSRDRWAVFGRYYLPEQTVNRSENAHYQGWETEGRLIATPGVVTDFDYIIDQLEDYASRFDLIEIVLDPYHAGPLVVTLEKRGLPAPIQVRQSAPNMSPAMIELEGLVLSKKIRHDGDPVLAWMMGNVTAHRSGDLMQPRKDSEEKKIDGATALLMCINRELRREQPVDPGAIWVI